MNDFMNDFMNDKTITTNSKDRRSPALNSAVKTGVVTRILITLPLMAAIATGCAQDKRKRDNLTRVRGVTGKTMPTSTESKPTEESPTPAPTTEGTQEASVPVRPQSLLNNDALQSGLSQNGSSTQRPSSSQEISSSRYCRIVAAEALAAQNATQDAIQQPFCESLVIETDDNGNILNKSPRPLHTIENMGPIVLKLEENLNSEIRQINEKTVITFNLKSEKTPGEKDILFLAYLLPHKIEEIDPDSVTVTLQGQPIAKSDFTVTSSKEPGDASKAKVQITNLDLFQNVNFELLIEYQIQSSPTR